MNVLSSHRGKGYLVHGLPGKSSSDRRSTSEDNGDWSSGTTSSISPLEVLGVAGVDPGIVARRSSSTPGGGNGSGFRRHRAICRACNFAAASLIDAKDSWSSVSSLPSAMPCAERRRHETASVHSRGV